VPAGQEPTAADWIRHASSMTGQDLTRNLPLILRCATQETSCWIEPHPKMDRLSRLELIEEDAEARKSSRWGSPDPHGQTGPYEGFYEVLLAVCPARRECCAGGTSHGSGRAKVMKTVIVGLTGTLAWSATWPAKA
jgi:hypothetical protein